MTIQSILHMIEEGRGQILIRLAPLVITVLVICALLNTDGADLPIVGHLGGVYHGLNDAQSMDNAQLARQISRDSGYTTEFIRPYALTQLRDFATTQNLTALNGGKLFPPDQFPPGTPRIIPDTYNPPGYPTLLAGWFLLLRPHFDQPVASMGEKHFYTPDRLIPVLNQILLALTALLVFALGKRLFDDRVAWMSVVSFLASDIIWQYSMTALSTTFLMLVVTASLYAILRIFQVSEEHVADSDRPYWPAWVWGLLLILLFAVSCLTRLHLLIMLGPLVAFLVLMPRPKPALFVGVPLLILVLVVPWFWHLYTVSGNALGSNMLLVVYGQEGYEGDQIFRGTGVPKYEAIFRNVTNKEYVGFRWHLDHAWELLGSSPMILFFGASILHSFKRRRAQYFRWLVVGSAVVLIAANNIGVPKPDPLSPWNTLFVLFPCMLVIGSAFFFILVDRLNLPVRMFQSGLICCTLLLTAYPLAIHLTSAERKFYNYPPYIPPYIKLVGNFAQADEWIASDMPWACAWYTDRPSIWIPDTLTEFEKIYDNICPSGILLLTPATLERPAANLITGEDKEWFTFVVGAPAPSHFPLREHTTTGKGGPDYTVWSDQARWKK